jgi:hypothetical protein
VDRQESRTEKIALCAKSCAIAKMEAVKDFGIGEDLTFTLFGWKDSEMIVIAQLHPQHMSIDPELRLKKVHFCASILRRAWGVDEITFMAEGYCSREPELSRGKSLAMLFADSETSVSECLTFTHVDSEGAALVVVPYRQNVGRRVEWGEAELHNTEMSLRDSAYPKAIFECLSIEPETVDVEADVFYDTIAEGLSEQGFGVQYLAP